MFRYLKFLPLAFCTLFFFACGSSVDRNAREKQLMDSIMTKHEELMGAEDKLMENKMALDSLVKTNAFDSKDSAARKAEMRVQSKKLKDADEAMEKWMHDFDPNNANRPGDAKLKYLQEQNQQMDKIDSLMTGAIKTSTQLFAQPKK